MRKVIIAAFFLGILLFSVSPAPALDIIERPIFTLDPCLFATATVDVTPETWYDISGTGSGPYYSSIIRYDLIQSGTTIGNVISSYKRVTIGGEKKVSMEDTMIIGNLVIYGRSSNNGSGIMGARGIVVGIVDGGTPITGNTITYRLSTFGSKDRLCFFVTTP